MGGSGITSPVMSARSTAAAGGYSNNSFTSPRGSDISIATSSSAQRKPAVPRANDLAKLAPKSHKNHIVENRRSAVHLHPPNLGHHDDDGTPRLHKSYGEVPAYLQVWKEGGD